MLRAWERGRSRRSWRRSSWRSRSAVSKTGPSAASTRSRPSVVRETVSPLASTTYSSLVCDAVVGDRSAARARMRPDQCGVGGHAGSQGLVPGVGQVQGCGGLDVVGVLAPCAGTGRRRRSSGRSATPEIADLTLSTCLVRRRPAPEMMMGCAPRRSWPGRPRLRSPRRAAPAPWRPRSVSGCRGGSRSPAHGAWRRRCRPGKRRPSPRRSSA